MKFIKDLKEGERIGEVYLIQLKISGVSKNGKPYERLVLRDRTGIVDAMVWDPNSGGIEEADALDYVHITGDVTVFNGNPQIRVNRLRKCRQGEYDESNYVPVSKRDNSEMYRELLSYVDSIKNKPLNTLMNRIFREDEDFIKLFRKKSAAKSVHHAFVGGLMEHTLGVAKVCEFLAMTYSDCINRDLLICSALCHDMGKVTEFSDFPVNGYTDDGQLLGHIVTGMEMIGAYVRTIPDFPADTERSLKHCILSHHGELEFGSPKKPMLTEAIALNFADNADAKLQICREALEGLEASEDWTKRIYAFDSPIMRTKL